MRNSSPKMISLNVKISQLTNILRQLTPPVLWRFAFRRAIIKDIPHNYAYDPHYYPWLEPDFQARVKQLEGRTAVEAEPIYTLSHFLKQSLFAEGDVIECGVWKGGTARILRDELLQSGSHKQFHLFDSFEGMSQVDPGTDRHLVGHFSDTSLSSVQCFVMGSEGDDPQGIAHFHPGWIPSSFKGLEKLRVCFAHIDLDLYQSIFDAIAFVYPRMSSAGIVVFDDYGFASCPGAKRAIDEFFADKEEDVFVLRSGQALVIKH